MPCEPDPRAWHLITGLLPFLGNNMKKCRARYGLDQQSQWCKPCRYVCRVYKASSLRYLCRNARRPRVHNADHLRAYRKSVLSRCCRRLSPSETGSAGGTPLLPFAIAERNVEFRVTIARCRSTDAFAATLGVALRNHGSRCSATLKATRGFVSTIAVSSTSGCPALASGLRHVSE
jgi:hypothetical protein